MISLNTQTFRFDLVIDFPSFKVESDLINKLKDYLVNNSIEYSFIVHDKDVDENGLLKVPHIHVLYIKSKRRRLRTELFELSDYLFNDDKKTKLISITRWSSYEERLQYLIHKNDFDKYQYDLESIVTSIPLEELKLIFQRDLPASVSISTIINTIDKCDSLSEVYSCLGLEYCRLYHNIIRDLYRERKSSEKPLPF